MNCATPCTRALERAGLGHDGALVPVAELALEALLLGELQPVLALDRLGTGAGNWTLVRRF